MARTISRQLATHRTTASNVSAPATTTIVRWPYRWRPCFGSSQRHLDQKILASKTFWRACWVWSGSTGKTLIGQLREDRINDLERGLAQVTAVQSVPSRRSLETLLMADSKYGARRQAPIDVRSVVSDLCRLYARDGDGVAQLEPDLLGEHFVANVADAELIEGCLAWIESQPSESQSKRRQQLLTLLQRATQPVHGQRTRAASECQLDHLIAKHMSTLAAEMVAVMLSTPGSLADRIGCAADKLDDWALTPPYQSRPFRLPLWHCALPSCR